MEDGEKKVSVSALKAIKDRRSIRKFKSEPISEMDLHTILEAGIAAPSSKNRQPWHFTVVRGEAKEELTRVMERGLNLEVKAHEPFLPDSMKFINGAFTSVNVMREAPVVVLVSNERGKGIDFTDNLSVDERVAEICNVESIAAAIENMLLTATEIHTKIRSFFRRRKRSCGVSSESCLASRRVLPIERSNRNV